MRVRSIDIDSDWLFGKGRNDYKRDLKATMQNLQTRLSSFLGDCFFDLEAGIDWLNLLGAKDQLPLELAISSVILNTQDVTGLLLLNVSRDSARNLTLTYRVQTSYGTSQASFSLDLSQVG